MGKTYFIPKTKYNFFIKTMEDDKIPVSKDDSINKIFITEIEDLGVKINNNMDDIDVVLYLTDNFNIKKSVIDSKKFDVIVFNSHNEINYIRNKKITELLCKLNINDLSIFNYSTYGEYLNNIEKINSLKLNGNIHSMHNTKIICNIPNNLPENIINLSITSPPDDHTYIFNFPNKLKILSCNFFINYPPNSLTKISQSNDKISNIKYTSFNNKINEITLSNPYINNCLIINKLPINLLYLEIKSESMIATSCLNRHHNNCSNRLYGNYFNFKINKNIIKHYIKKYKN
jgi:hypothetical protein